jgi:hypothetical protein
VRTPPESIRNATIAAAAKAEEPEMGLAFPALE